MQGDKAVLSTNARSRSVSRKRRPRCRTQEREFPTSRFLHRGKKWKGKRKEEERERAREKRTQITELIEIHLRPPFVFAPPFLSISSSFMCLRAHGCARYSRHDAPWTARTRRGGTRTRIHAREHAHSVIALYCALRRLELESDQDFSYENGSRNNIFRRRCRERLRLGWPPCAHGAVIDLKRNNSGRCSGCKRRK